jgi:hypothetical protein
MVDEGNEGVTALMALKRSISVVNHQSPRHEISFETTKPLSISSCPAAIPTPSHSLIISNKFQRYQQRDNGSIDKTAT